jgi:hypothetical protein
MHEDVLTHLVHDAVWKCSYECAPQGICLGFYRETQEGDGRKHKTSRGEGAAVVSHCTLCIAEECMPSNCFL